MYYFLNDHLGPLASGVEHAELKRIRLFNQFGVPAQLVTIDYSATTRSDNAVWQLAEQNFVNLYDFYAGTEAYAATPLTLADLPVAQQGYRLEKQAAGASFWDGQRRVATVQYATNRQAVISTVTYFDAADQKSCTDIYDERGFRAYTKYWTTTAAPATTYLALEQFYTLTGQIYLEITYQQRGTSVVATNYRLRTSAGQVKSCIKRDQMITQFYDDLNQRDGGGNTFISDRTAVANLPMTLMQTPARKVEYLHSVHFDDYREPFQSQLVYDSLRYTDQLSRTDLIVTATPQQAQDLRQRLRTQVPIVNIPVGMVETAQLEASPVPIDAAPRIKGKVVIVARLFAEKNLSDAILAFKAAYEQLPWLTLDIYGYGDAINGNHETQRLHQLVESTGLQAVVTFKGYTPHLETVYQQAQLMLLSSHLEGFALALLEANAQGVPVISYDTYYGPAYIIKQAQNGYVVPYGDRAAMTAKIILVMTDAALRQRLSTGAYQRASDFSTANVWQLWQQQVIETDPAL